MREQCLSDQLAADVDNWEDWQSETDRQKQEELFNILDELDRIWEENLKEEWTPKPKVQEKKRKGRKKKVEEPLRNNRKITEFTVKKPLPTNDMF